MAFYLGLRKYFAFIFLISIFSLSSSALIDKEEKVKKKLRKEPYRILNNFNFSENKKIISKIDLPPAFVLRYLKELDGKDDYIPYMPDAHQKKMIDSLIKRLPVLHQKVFQKRLIGIYFVKNFTGNGFTEWVLDENDHIYFFMVFNYSVLHKSIDEAIAARIESCFIPDSEYSIKAEVSKKEKALFYLLLHEGAHGVDYVMRLQKYVDPQSFYFQKRFPIQLKYEENIWKSYNNPLKEYDFSFRDKITFYGLSRGPKIKFSNSARLYRNFEKSVFPSIYASLSWAEDLAESLTLYHLIHKENLLYKIHIYHKNKKIYTYTLNNRKKVLKRMKKMSAFYFPEQYSIFLPKE